MMIVNIPFPFLHSQSYSNAKSINFPEVTEVPFVKVPGICDPASKSEGKVTEPVSYLVPVGEKPVTSSNTKIKPYVILSGTFAELVESKIKGLIVLFAPKRLFTKFFMVIIKVFN
jgi:hypothetical protein